jgi:hypothetical protein
VSRLRFAWTNREVEIESSSYRKHVIESWIGLAGLDLDYEQASNADSVG